MHPAVSTHHRCIHPARYLCTTKPFDARLRCSQYFSTLDCLVDSPLSLPPRVGYCLQYLNWVRVFSPRWRAPHRSPCPLFLALLPLERPTQGIGTLSATPLKHLNLGRNQLTSLPPELGKVTCLYGHLSKYAMYNYISETTHG